MNDPEQSRGSCKLRKGRQSFAHSLYFITTSKRPEASPLANDLCFQAVLETLDALEQEEVLECFAFTLMPDHVHVLARLGVKQSLSKAVQRFKGASAHRINNLLGRLGSVWLPGYYDRQVRYHEKVGDYVKYIFENPRNSGLVVDPAKWPYTRVRWELVGGRD
jgi:REP element-mobilizing transposase RayT